MSERDLLHRFIFTHAEDEYVPGTPQSSYAGGARGELVQLEAAWQSILSRSDYPPAVARLLGETAVAAVLLAATLKIDGKLTLQVQGEGTVHLLVMQVTSERELRGLARWHGEVEGEGLTLMGDGRLVMTIETARGERYQGIVPLEGATLAQALEGYFARSEQLPTRLWLEAGPTRAAGLLVQKMPGHDSPQDDEDWNRIVALSETVSAEELLELPAEILLHRLYHEEDRLVFEPESVRFACSCSRERVAEMLRSLRQDEVEDILAEQGKIEVHCEFCNARYTFDAVDAAALFVETPHPEARGLH
ncbi:MAG: Hsp33 family molecular chaperone HslO [Gammaproteobacteria bacterium]|nr:Hsp33 family molecular chaperone HslO [Gammaproteobacteria bacterium]